MVQLVAIGLVLQKIVFSAIAHQPHETAWIVTCKCNNQATGHWQQPPSVSPTKIHAVLLFGFHRVAISYPP
jgi:hypothetical protein